MALSIKNISKDKLTSGIKDKLSSTKDKLSSGIKDASIGIKDLSKGKLNPNIFQGASEESKEPLINPKKSIEGIKDTVSSAVKDPFGAAIKNVLFRVNSLFVIIESKIDGLVTDILKKADSKGRVSLQGNNLVITATQENINDAIKIKTKVELKINSIRNTIVILNNLINTLIAIKTAIEVYKALLDVQETLLIANPATGPIFKVFKQSIKIVFTKQVVGEYLKVLEKTLLSNKRSLFKLSERFRALQVSVKIENESTKGNFIDQDAAEILLAQDLLNYRNIDPDQNLDTDSQQFIDNNFNTYILKVEKYDEKQLIGRAYDEFSGLIKAQTAPSYFSTPDQLFEEIKAIINSQI